MQSIKCSCFTLDVETGTIYSYLVIHHLSSVLGCTWRCHKSSTGFTVSRVRRSKGGGSDSARVLRSIAAGNWIISTL